MTLLGHFRQVRNDAPSIENPEQPLTSQTLLDFLGVQGSASGKNVNEITALGSAAWWRGVQLTTQVPATLPFKAFRDSDNVRNEMAAGTQAQQLMTSPHPDLTRSEFWRIVHGHRKTWGNAYVYMVRNRLSQAEELWPIHPSRIQVGRISKFGSKVYVLDGEEVLTDAEILHFPGFGYDGICGVSPLRAARESVGFSLAAQEFGAKLFGSGSLASGILQTEQRLTTKQADALANRWRAKHTGMNSAFDTIVLDKGAEFKQLTITPEDSQFLDSRRFQVVEVCRWLGFPPFLMFETETSTSWGTGLEQQALAWVKFDLVPELVPIEERVNRVIYPRPAYSKHNVEGLMRGDAAARSAFYKALWDIGGLSTNEIRAKEELPPIEGGDTHYRPLNYGVLGEDNPAPDPAPTPQEA